MTRPSLTAGFLPPSSQQQQCPNLRRILFSPLEFPEWMGEWRKPIRQLWRQSGRWPRSVVCFPLQLLTHWHIFFSFLLPPSSSSTSGYRNSSQHWAADINSRFGTLSAVDGRAARVLKLNGHQKTKQKTTTKKQQQPRHQDGNNQISTPKISRLLSLLSPSAGV